MKREFVQGSQLSADRPRKVISLPWDETSPVSSEATVYANLASGEPTGIVGLRLVAECLGHEQVIAAAGIPPGFDGIVAIASGISVDSWHVEAWGGARDARLNVAIAIRQCCSGFGVFVPPEVQAQIPLLAGETRARGLPMSRADGLWRVESDDQPGSVVLDAGDRVTRIVVTARAMADAVVSGITPTWQIIRRETREVQPRGNLQGPRTLGFANVDYYAVEIVR